MWILGSGLSAESPPSDVEEIKATLIAMWDTIERGDLEADARPVHPDFTQFGESDVYLTEGKESEVGSIRRYVERATNVHDTAVP